MNSLWAIDLRVMCTPTSPVFFESRSQFACVTYAHIEGRQAIQSLALDDINAILVADILVQSEVRHKIAAPGVQPLHVTRLRKRGQTDCVFGVLNAISKLTKDDN